MLVGLMSDTHDRLPAVLELGRLLQERGVGMVLHAGDFCAPFSLLPFQELGLAVAGVFGRNDGDHEGLRAVAAKGVGIEIYEAPHSIELSGKRLLLVHDLADLSERSIESHEIVVHGFTHRPEMKVRGETLLVNPGEACGWLHGSPQAAIVDLDTKRVEFLSLTESEWKA